MGKPATYDITWVRGSTTPLLFAITRGGTPIAFDDIRLTVYNNKGKSLCFRASYAEHTGITIIDALTGSVKFQPTAAQTRALTQSKDGITPMNTYEVEYRDGDSEEIYLMGNIIAIGGINDDEGAS